MKKEKIYNQKKIRRAKRVRKQISRGTASHPRLSVFRSNTHISAQLIDDEAGKTLVSVSSVGMKKDTKKKKGDIAKEVGKLLAEKAEKAGISAAVFDRGSYRYHGRVKALAEGAREGKLKI